MELLRLREQSWKAKLAAVSLCAEAAVDPEQLEETLGVLGRMFRLAERDSTKRVRLRAYPAVHVLSTTLVAAEHYDHGTFWPKLSELIEHSMTQSDQRLWGQAFLFNLEALGMPAFKESADAGTRYVGRILLHGGVPSSGLFDLYRLVAAQRTVTPGLSAEEFVEWARKAQLYVDAPVQRFLRHGGEYAVDVADRIFELLDLAQRKGDLTQVPLPERFRVAARELALQETVGDSNTRQLGERRDAAERPRLMLHPGGRGVVLRLPPVSEAPDGRAVWLVGIGGERQRIQTQSAWPGSAEPAPSTDVTIQKQVRSVTAALESRADLVATVPVVDDEFPLLGFSVDGQRLSTVGVWRESRAWLLFPGGPDDLQIEGEVHVERTAYLPPGWAGWTLVLADLSKVQSLGLNGFTRTQSVRHRVAAELITGLPVPGVTTSSGAEVWAKAPKILLPSDGTDSTWQVAVLDHTGDVLTAYDYEVPDGGGWATDIWDVVERPLVGTYTVRVRGPWGRGFSRSLTIVEGLQVTTSPEWRRFDGPGLVPARSILRAAEGVQLSDESIEFGPLDVTHRARAWCGLRFKALVLEPSHMSVLHQTNERTQGPRTRALDLATEELVTEAGELVLLTGTEAAPEFHYVVDSSVVQSMTPRSQQGGSTHRVDLSVLKDTLAAHPVGRICLLRDGSLSVASIRPGRLFSEVRWDGAEIEVVGAVDQAGLSLLLYPTTAPWAPPVSIPVVNGRAAPPVHLVGAGTLRVMVRIDDPWFPEPAPVWPGRGASVLLEATGCVVGDSAALSELLGGLRDDLGDVDLGHLWLVAGRRFGLPLGDRFPSVMSTVRQRLNEDPQASLAALGDCALDVDAQLEALLWSGLVCVSVAEADAPSAMLRFDERALLPTVLRLASQPALGEHRSAWVEACAGAASEILAGVPDQHARAGRLDGQSDLYAAWSESQQRQMQAVLGLVPHGPVHGDARTLAAIHVVDKRVNEYAVDFYKRTETIVRTGVILLGRSDVPQLRNAIEERCHPTRPKGWRAATAASLILALAARLGARGDAEAAHFFSTYSQRWTAFARVVPDLVRNDLVLAETLIRGALTPEPDPADETERGAEPEDAKDEE